MKKPLFMLGLLINQVVFAGVQADLDGFFNDLGYMSNTTSPGVYNSQAAGSYAGGSLLVGMLLVVLHAAGCSNLLLLLLVVAFC